MGFIRAAILVALLIVATTDTSALTANVTSSDSSTDDAAAASVAPTVQQPQQQPNVQQASVTKDSRNTVQDLEKMLESKMKKVDDVMRTLGRQIIDLQTVIEERVRSEGQSGVKKTRLVHNGNHNYFYDNHVSASAASAHDHADYLYVLGMGEFTAVLNGIEFRTRHNDYLLRQPAKTPDYQATDRIPYPDVPPEVLNKPTLKEQVLEMREWYKAFKNQDYSVRDYRKYFKPNLCYVEGAWTLSSRDTLQEPFKSDRHHLEAESWFDLSEKIRFTSYTGHMNALENFAYLPTAMYNITEDGIPQIAQWNYRMLCHPLSKDLPTSIFKLQDDLPYRMAHDRSMDKMFELRGARFKLDEYNIPRKTKYTLLDELMHEIPGMDNYGANITDNAFGLMNYDNSRPDQVPLNVGYYHRQYKIGYRGAMGGTDHFRGFNDPNMWVAMNTQKNIMPLTMKICEAATGCDWQTRRVSYAFPLEVFYTSPLNSWNPYDFAFDTPEHVEKKDRNGAFDRIHAFNGTSYRHYYRTPAEFYHDDYNTSTPTPDTVGMLDRNGEVKAVAASGITMVTPNIDGVGKVRLRYHIFPVHSDASTLGEQQKALQDMVMQMSRYSYLYEEPPLTQTSFATGTGGTAPGQQQPRALHFRLGDTSKPSLHGHDVILAPEEFRILTEGAEIKITTSVDAGHSHELELRFDLSDLKLHIKTCDDKPQCWDGHPDTLIPQ